MTGLSEADNKTRILIVDDEEALREIVMRELELTIDAEYLFASNGVEALKVIEQTPPTLVLTDMRMPVMDGLELIKEIEVRGLNITTIVMSGFGDLDKFRRAWRLGAFNFIDKPIDFDQLRSIVRDALTAPTRPKENAETDISDPPEIFDIESSGEEQKKEPDALDSAILVAISPDLIRDLTLYCKEEMISVDEMISDAIRAYLDSVSKAKDQAA